MNCIPNDLAIVVGFETNSIILGRIVECLKFVPMGLVTESPDLIRWKAVSGDCWIVDYNSMLPFSANSKRKGLRRYGLIADKHLRPIRDQPGEDESLTWAKVPNNDHISV